MKLSELSTERAADVLCEITPYVASLTGDKALLDALKTEVGAGGKSVAEVYTMGAKKIASIVPIVLKDHRQDVFGILAALNETDVETITRQNILKTILQIRELAKDKELADFFKSWGQQEASV